MPHDFKCGDIVRIVKHHDGAPLDIVGRVGFIDGMHDVKGVGYAYFYGLESDGRPAGSGWLPEDCLSPIDERAWAHAKELHDERIRKLMEDADRRTKEQKLIQKRALELSSSELGLKIEEIFNIVNVYNRSLSKAQEELS